MVPVIEVVNCHGSKVIMQQSKNIHTQTWQKCSYHINYTCSKCAIYWQIVKSGAMMGIEILKYRQHTVLALTSGKIWEFSLFNEVKTY